MLSVRTVCVIAATADALAACAGPQSTARLDTARADFQGKIRAQKGLQYDLAHPGKLAPAELARREATALKAFSPVCVKPYTEKLQASVALATERATASVSLAPIETLPETARMLDREFDKCLAGFGVVGFNFFKLEDGRELRAPDYLSETIASLHAWGNARATVASEQQDNAALVVASLGGGPCGRRRRQSRSNICRAVPSQRRHGGSRPLAHKSQRDLPRQYWGVSLMKHMLLIAVALLAPSHALAGERMIDLFRQGYQVVATEPYLSFEGCEFDKPIKVGGYIFMCRTYEYIYHYGKVELLGRTFTAKGQSISSVYLCAGEEHCLRGDLYTR